MRSSLVASFWWLAGFGLHWVDTYQEVAAAPNRFQCSCSGSRVATTADRSGGLRLAELDHSVEMTRPRPNSLWSHPSPSRQIGRTKRSDAVSELTLCRVLFTFYSMLLSLVFDYDVFLSSSVNSIYMRFYLP